MTYKKNFIGLLLLLIAMVLVVFALISVNSQVLLITEPDSSLVIEAKMEKTVVTAPDGDNELLMDDYSDSLVLSKDATVVKLWLFPSLLSGGGGAI